VGGGLTRPIEGPALIAPALRILQAVAADAAAWPPGAAALATRVAADVLRAKPAVPFLARVTRHGPPPVIGAVVFAAFCLLRALQTCGVLLPGDDNVRCAMAELAHHMREGGLDFEAAADLGPAHLMGLDG